MCCNLDVFHSSTTTPLLVNSSYTITDPFTLKFLYLVLVALVANMLQPLCLGQLVLQSRLSLSQVKDFLLQDQVFASHLMNKIKYSNATVIDTIIIHEKQERKKEERGGAV